LLQSKAKQSVCGPWFYALWDDELEILDALQPTSSRFCKETVVGIPSAIL
jgi:hypothetical protein